ncbi:MAG TPA: tRNA uracil 4-sulfurtransferase ThiI [Kofleriaceae bacterium]|nr:tRNA uracil 4-sulfurtransferase ThiI [Kofleriaceae bacterium]
MPFDPSADVAPREAPGAAPPARGLVLLRLGEIFLKGRNRRVFVRALVDNARRLMGGLDGVTIESQHLRVLVHHPPELERRVLERLGHLFGLHSMAPAVAVPRELDAMAEAAIAEARLLPAGSTFKVETNRRDKRFAMTSQEISRAVGGRVVQATGLPVDVHGPQSVLRIEVGSDASYLFRRLLPGPGGLPVGTGGHVALLLSGGIDSPVAGWSAMRRGCTLSAVYFHSFPYTGDRTREKVLDLARRMSAWHGPIAVHIVHFTEVQKALRAHGPAELAVLLYRRMMMRAASRIAAAQRAKALVTGENLGQVASQTLDNLGVIEEAAELPVLRPLLTFDKSEIIARAQAIGTYDLSILPYDDCCTLFVPRHPATHARVQDLASAEAGLDVGQLAQELADRSERVLVR